MKAIKIFFIFIFALIVITGCRESKSGKEKNAVIRLLGDNRHIYLSYIDTVRFRPQDTLTFIYDLNEKFVPGWQISRIPYGDTIMVTDKSQNVMYRRGVIEEFR